MQEKLAAYWHTIEPHLRMVVFALFILMLLIVVYLKNNDGADVVESTSGPAKATVDKVPPTGDLVKKVHESLAKTPSPISSTQYAPLITNSMFDVKAVHDAVEQEKTANDKYQQAFLLFNEKKYREAYDLANQCLKIRQNHLPAKKLMGEIEQILEGVRTGRKPDSSAQ
jgi:hypothetical protein